MVDFAPLFDDQNPMRVAALFSGGASGVEYLLERSPELGDLYRIIVGFCDRRNVPGVDKLESRGVPVEVVARADFYPEGKITPDAREHYFEALYEKLKAYNPDLIVLSGFMQIVTDPLLSGFRNRILNVHPADLRIEEGGKRKFVGDDTVYDAVQAGEEHLRSSVHIVSEQVDQGALMAVSRPLPVETELVEVLKEKAPEKIRGYADALQEWLKWEGDGPCLDQALQLIARGVVGTKAKSGIVFDMGGQIVQGYYDLKGEKIRTAR